MSDNSLSIVTAKHVELAKKLGVYLEEVDSGYVLYWKERLTPETYATEFHAWLALPRLDLLERAEKRLQMRAQELEQVRHAAIERARALSANEMVKAIKRLKPIVADIEDFAYELGREYARLVSMPEVHTINDAARRAEVRLWKRFGKNTNFKVINTHTENKPDEIIVTCEYQYQEAVYSGGTMDLLISYGQGIGFLRNLDYVPLAVPKPTTYEGERTVTGRETFTFVKAADYHD